MPAGDGYGRGFSPIILRGYARGGKSGSRAWVWASTTRTCRARLPSLVQLQERFSPCPCSSIPSHLPRPRRPPRGSRAACTEGASQRARWGRRSRRRQSIHTRRRSSRTVLATCSPPSSPGTSTRRPPGTRINCWTRCTGSGRCWASSAACSWEPSSSSAPPGSPRESCCTTKAPVFAPRFIGFPW